MNESRRAVAHVPGVRMYCTGCGAVLWVKRFSCVLCVCLWMGRCGGLTRKDGSLPTQRGGSTAVATPSTWTDLLGAHAERVPDCSSYLSCIPWIARRWIVSLRTSVSCLIKTSALLTSLRPRRRCIRGPRGYCLQPVTGLKLRALNSAGIRARSSP